MKKYETFVTPVRTSLTFHNNESYYQFPSPERQQGYYQAFRKVAKRVELAEASSPVVRDIPVLTLSRWRDNRRQFACQENRLEYQSAGFVLGVMKCQQPQQERFLMPAPNLSLPVVAAFY
ncbi:MAG: hypothetical protein ROO76_16310 [Terriglobia bacterium]|jgi:hypothetical protein|nr:hypothetical protein [Terriglobia bacterium]